MDIGTYTIHFDQLSSTNDFALKLLRLKSPPDGMVISTHFQSKGKGQHDSIWVSEPGQNITLSIIVYPNFLESAAIYLLNKAVCLGVAKCVEHYVDRNQVRIKWPNDILVNEYKICGILIQNTIMGKSIQNSVIGIGLNVNQFVFPDGIKATSLKLINNEIYNVNKVCKDLFHYLQESLSMILAGYSNLINADYHSRLFGLNQLRNFLHTGSGRTFKGKIIAVDQQGKLHVYEDEQIRIYQVKEIEFLI